MDMEKVAIRYWGSSPLIDNTTGGPIEGKYQHQFLFSAGHDLYQELQIPVGTVYWFGVIAIYQQEEAEKWNHEPDFEHGYSIPSWGAYKCIGNSSSFEIANEAAGDWLCFDNGTVNEIDWYGAFDGWREELPYLNVNDTKPPMPDYFMFSLHESQRGPCPWCHDSPAEPPIERVVIPVSHMECSYYGSKGKIDYATRSPIEGAYDHIYEFWTVFPEQWILEGPRIYWIKIVAMYQEKSDTSHVFSWHESNSYSCSDPWLAGWDYCSRNDMAFSLYFSPEEDEDARLRKEPDMWYGFNNLSWGTCNENEETESYVIENEIIDEYVNWNGLPITEAGWYGSFDGWMGEKRRWITGKQPHPCRTFSF